MARDQRVNDGAAQRLQLVEGADFVVGHEPRIAHNVGRQHGGQTANDVVICGVPRPCCQVPLLWPSATDRRLSDRALSLGYITLTNSGLVGKWMGRLPELPWLWERSPSP